jgi:hypothetical protein
VQMTSQFGFNKRKQEASAEAEYAETRNRKCRDEFSESYGLLLELVHQEPTFTQAFRIIQTQVLQGDIKLTIDGQMASKDFLRFAQEHYVPFCKAAIKAMFAYGFVPWHFRKIMSGDLVPEVLPAGTFTWSIIQGNTASHDCDYGDDASKSLLYDVKLSSNANALARSDVYIYEVTQPTWNISQGSNVHACYPSPISHIILDYKNLRTAMNNRAHADTWNTQAHIITKQQSKTFQQDPSATFLEAGMNSSNQYTYERAQLQLHTRDQDIQDMFNKKATAHMPYLYTLPMDVSLEQTQNLTPCADIPFLDNRLKHEISMLTGVPPDLLTNTGRGSANESSARTRSSTSQFHTSMDNIAQVLQKLLQDIYRRAYHSDTSPSSSLQTESSEKKLNKKAKKRACPDIQWFLEVAPPISLDTVDDLVKLSGIEGALNSHELRRVVHMLLYGKGTSAGSGSDLSEFQAHKILRAESKIIPVAKDKADSTAKKKTESTDDKSKSTNDKSETHEHK